MRFIKRAKLFETSNITYFTSKFSNLQQNYRNILCIILEILDSKISICYHLYHRRYRRHHHNYRHHYHVCI